MIYLLFLLIILIFIIAYLVTRDLFHPTCLMCMTFTLSVFCAILNIEKWGISLNGFTVFIIIIGILSFTISGLITYTKKNILIDEIYRDNIIKYSKTIMLVLVMIQLIFVLLQVFWLSGQFGGVLNLFNSKMMTKFRFDVSFDNKISYPEYIGQGFKYNKALVYILSFIEINNFIVLNKSKKKYNTNKLMFLSIILYFLQTFLSGGRSELILFGIAIVGEFFILEMYYTNKNGIKLGKNFLKIIVITLAVLYAFSFTRTFVGRTSQDSFVDYVSRYFGGSIQLLDMYIDNPIQKSNIFGKETFYGINKFLGQLGLLKIDYTLHLEFRQSNGVELGNVYTCFRRMLYDFGVWGVIILNLIFGFIMGIYYNKIKTNKNIKKSLFSCVFYFMILHSVILTPFSDFFFSTVLSFNYLNIIVYMKIIIFLVTRVKTNSPRGEL